MVVQCLSTVYRLEGDNAALPSTPLPLAVRVSLVVSYLSNHSKQAIFAKAVSTGAAPVVVVRFKGLCITIEFTFTTARSCPRHLHPDHNHNHVIRSGVLHHVTQSHHITHPQASSTDVERAEQHKNQGRTESHHITHTMSHA